MLCLFTRTSQKWAFKCVLKAQSKEEIPSDGEETLHYFLRQYQPLVLPVNGPCYHQSLATFICGTGTRDRKIIRNKLLKDLVPNVRYHQTNTRQLTSDTYGNNLQPPQSVLVRSMIQLIFAVAQTDQSLTTVFLRTITQLLDERGKLSNWSFRYHKLISHRQQSF